MEDPGTGSGNKDSGSGKMSGNTVLVEGETTGAWGIMKGAEHGDQAKGSGKGGLDRKIVKWETQW